MTEGLTATMVDVMAEEGSFSLRKRPFFYFMMIPLFLLAVVLIYAGLPKVGFSALAKLLSGPRVLMLATAAIGATIYGFYLDRVIRRPWYLIFFMFVVWKLLGYWNYALAASFVKFNVRTLCFFLVGVPTVVLTVQNFKHLWEKLPAFKWLFFFELISLGFFVFHSSSFINPGNITYEHATASRIFMIDFTYMFFMAVIAFIGFDKHPEKHHLFDAFNKTLMIYCLIESMCAILGYPMGMFTRVLEGFKRAEGFCEHPNRLAFTYSIYFLYFLGLSYYYAVRENLHRVSRPLLTLVMALVGITLLLTVSKNPIITLILAYMVFNTAQAFIYKNYKTLVTMCVVLGLIPVALGVFSLATGTDIVGVIQDRMADGRSMEWRLGVWQALVDDVTFKNIWLGHGMGSADEFMYHMFSLLYRKQFDIFYVHNATVQLLFEFGLVGIFYYMPLLVAAKTFLKRLNQPVGLANRIMALSGLAMLFYFVIYAQCDQIIVFFPLGLFWGLLNILTSYTAIESTDLIKNGAIECPLHPLQHSL